MEPCARPARPAIGHVLALHRRISTLKTPRGLQWLAMGCRLRATAASETLTPLGDKLGSEGVRLTSFKVECTPSRLVFRRSAPTPVRRLRLACLAGCTREGHSAAPRCRDSDSSTGPPAWRRAPEPKRADCFSSSSTTLTVIDALW